MLLTWVFAGMVFGIIYVLNGSLALPIGIHITFNLAYNSIFARTDLPGSEDYSTITRIDINPDLAFLQYGGLLDIAAFASVLLLAIGWLWRTRGGESIDLARSQLEPAPDLRGEPRRRAEAELRRAAHLHITKPYSTVFTSGQERSLTTITQAVPTPGAPTGHAINAFPLWPSTALRLEGALLLVIAAVSYGQLGASWWLFAALFLVPDVGMLGYLVGPRIGAAAYNLTHALSLPLLLGTVGLVTGSEISLTLAVIWVAHVGADRALGYGLKYPTHFRDTHLQRVG